MLNFRYFFSVCSIENRYFSFTARTEIMKDRPRKVTELTCHTHSVLVRLCAKKSQRTLKMAKALTLDFIAGAYVF